MPPKADPYNTPVHRRIDALLLVVAIAILAVLLSASAHAQTTTQLITYFNFNDGNNVSDAPGLQPSTITAGNSLVLTYPLASGTTKNQATLDATGAGLALHAEAKNSASGGSTLQFTVNTTGLTNLSLSFATRGSFASETITYTTSSGVTGTIGTVNLGGSTTEYQLASFTNLSAALLNQTSVTFTITLNGSTTQSNQFADFDNIQLTSEVPEPSTAATAVLALAGLAVFQRRAARRKRARLCGPASREA